MGGVAIQIIPDEELYHHGINGQKWGVRNGPPYPLGQSDHSASEKKAGWKKSLDSSDSSIKIAKKSNKTVDKKKQSDNNGDKGLSDSQKKAIKTGAVVVGALLATYGMYKLADSGELTRIVQKIKGYADGSDMPPWNIREDLADPNLSSDDIFKNVVSRINSRGELGSDYNCRRCTFAYELSRRGFDVKATKSIKGTGQSALGEYNATHDKKVSGGALGLLLSYYKGDDKDITDFVNNCTGNFATYLGPNEKRIELSTDAAKDIFSSLTQYPDRARGELSVAWKNGGNVGHSLAWEIINEKPVIFDVQQMTKYETVDDLKKLANQMSDASSVRLDNVDLNYDFLLKWAVNSH